MAEQVELGVRRALREEGVGARLAAANAQEAEILLRAVLSGVDPRIELMSLGEKPRGIVRELEVEWTLDGEAHTELVLLPEVSL